MKGKFNLAYSSIRNEGFIACIKKGFYYFVSQTFSKFIGLKPRVKYYYKRDKIVYLAIAKVASGSIKKSLDPGYKSTYYIDRRKYFMFTFVRNPFERLVSCYVNKFITNTEDFHYFGYENYLFGYLKNVNSFEDFVKKICKIPNLLKDGHFLRQYSFVYTRFGKCRVDYIGKFENLKKDFEPIRKKYNLRDLPHINNSKRNKYYFGMDYYTKDTAKIVYKMYKKDVKKFGYENAYMELLDYLDKKDNNKTLDK